jgi:hypothetical protein
MATAATRTVVILGGNLSEKEAAEYLGLTVHTMRRWRWSGDGPRFLKMGSRCLYPIAELDAFQATCLRKSTSDPSPTTKPAPAAKQAAKVTQIGKGKKTPSAGLSSPQKGQGGCHE